MFCQPPLECGLQRFTRIDEFFLPVNCIDPSLGRRYVVRKGMCGAALEFLNQLVREGLIKFKEKIMFFAHWVLSLSSFRLQRSAAFAFLALGLQLPEIF